MSGQQIGSVVGLVIGAYFGQPQLGAAIGGYIGGVIDPTVINGPSIGDAQQQTSQAGAPIPKVYGHAPPIAVTLIDGDKVSRKYTKTEDVGKGSTTKTKNPGFRATRFFLVCESQGDAKIGRITRNGKLVYSIIAGDDIDASSNDFASQLTIYDGGPTQGPDPSLEALHGVGNTPYYRGRLCFIVRDDDETDTRGAANQYRVEVISNGTITNSCEDEPGLIAWWPLDDASRNGVARELIGGYTGVYSDTSGVSSGPVLSPGSSGSFCMTAKTDYMVRDTTGMGGQPYSLFGKSEWTVSVYAMLNDGDPAHGGSVIRNIATFWADTILGYHDFALWLAGTDNLEKTCSYTKGGNIGVPLEQSGATGAGVPFQMVMSYSSAGYYKFYVNGSLVDSVLASSVGAPGSHGSALAVGGYDYPNSYGFIGCVSDLKVYNVQKSDAEIAQGYLYIRDYVVSPDGSGTYVGHDGSVYVPCYSRLEADEVYWKDIVADIAGRASSILPSKLDIDNMTDVVPGYVLGNPSLTAADYIRTLCTFYFVDLVEYDGLIHAIRRGGAIAGTLDDDDLIAVEDEDDDTRGQSTIEGSQRVSIVYPDPANNYIATPQSAPRSSPDVTSNNNVTIQCPIPFDADTAAQKADIIQKIQFLQVEGGFKRSFPAEYNKYVPSDPILRNDRRFLLTKVSYDDAMVSFEGTYDRPSAYTSNATGANAPPPSPPSSNLKGPTVFQAMNLSTLPGRQAVPGIYVAARGLLDNWPGAELKVSIDGGVTYVDVLTITNAATMGRLVYDVGTGSSLEPITVDLYGDDVLETITSDQIDVGQNQFAITTAGVQEVMQFQTADETSNGDYELTDITAPELGTIEADHYAGDSFVLLDANVPFIPIDPSLAGETIWFWPVTLGTADTSAGNPKYSVVFDPPTFIIDGGDATS